MPTIAPRRAGGNPPGRTPLVPPIETISLFSNSGELAVVVGRPGWWVTGPLLGQTSFLGLPSSRWANSLARHSASFMPCFGVLCADTEATANGTVATNVGGKWHDAAVDPNTLEAAR